MSLLVAIIVLFGFLIPDFIYPQSDTSKIFYFDDVRITAVQSNETNSMDTAGVRDSKIIYYKDLNTLKIINEKFVFSSGNGSNIHEFLADEIKKISFKNGNYLWSGALYGTLSGVALGFLIGSIAGNSKGSGHPDIRFDQSEIRLALSALFGITFGILGGVFGALTPKYEDYSINKIPPDKKMEKLMLLVKKHRNR